MEIKPEILGLISKEFAMEYRVFPKERGANGNLVLCWDGQGDQNQLTDELQVMLGCNISLLPLDQQEISRLLSKYYLGDESVESDEKEVTVI
jgi:general secretion pathway protein E/type IV pilus assembly protein PilB